MSSDKDYFDCDHGFIECLFVYIFRGIFKIIEYIFILLWQIGEATVGLASFLMQGGSNDRTDVILKLQISDKKSKEILKKYLEFIKEINDSEWKNLTNNGYNSKIVLITKITVDILKSKIKKMLKKNINEYNNEEILLINSINVNLESNNLDFINPIKVLKRDYNKIKEKYDALKTEDSEQIEINKEKVNKIIKEWGIWKLIKIYISLHTGILKENNLQEGGNKKISNLFINKLETEINNEIIENKKRRFKKEEYKIVLNRLINSLKSVSENDWDELKKEGYNTELVDYIKLTNISMLIMPKQLLEKDINKWSKKNKDFVKIILIGFENNDEHYYKPTNIFKRNYNLLEKIYNDLSK
jgi:hypothetical protein